MNKFLLVLLSIFIITVVCSPIAFATDETTPKFRLGVVVPLTGALAEYGTAIKNGFEMAREEIPESFSDITFVYEDSGYDGKTAVNALQKLRSSDAIDLYYLWGVSPTEAMLPIVHAEKLPVIAETTVKEATVRKPLIVRAARTGESIAKALAAEIQKRGITQISLVVTEIPFYTDIIKHLETILPGKGVSVKANRSVLPSDVDFKSFLLQRKSSQNEAIGVFLLPSQIIAFYRQMDQLKIKRQTFNADILDSVSLIEECPDNVNGTFFTQIGLTDEFRKKYFKRFGNDIQIGSAAQAYDIAQLVQKLFGDLNQKLSPGDMIERISKIKPQKGATGSFEFTDTEDAGKEIRMPVSMKVIKDKQITVITENTGF